MNFEKNTSTESPSALAEKASKKLLQNMEREGILKKYPGIYVKHIGENILASGREGNITVYDRFDEKGESEMVFNLIDIREGVFFDKAAYLAGYREITKRSTEGKLVYELYKLSDVDIKSGTPLAGKKPIDSLSLEYFEAWTRMDFFADKISLEAWKKPSLEGKLTKMPPETLQVLVQSGSVRIKDLVVLLKQNQIDKKTFQEIYPLCLSWLLRQIGDRRFDKVNDMVNREELDEYLTMGYLSRNTYEILIKKLQMVK